MADSNRLQLTRVTESTIGTTPGSPAMVKVRNTGETFKYALSTDTSKEIRSDRLTQDLIQMGARVTGGFNFEMSYGAQDEEIESAMFSTWQSTPYITNPTSDSNITQVTDSSDTYTVASGGASFKANHLVRAYGFTNANNNRLFQVASSTGTTVVAAGTPTLTDEAAPPAGASLKVVGFRGASGDITAAAGGLASTTLDFTTLGLVAGQWIKIGGSTAGEKFANVAANNDFVRITAIAAHAITCDNLPSGWGVDNGSSKTITVYMSDYIRIGTTKKAMSYEKADLSQVTPYYLLHAGNVVNKLNIALASRAVAKGSFDFLGFVASGSTTSVDSSPDAAPANDVLSCATNIGRIAEAGAVIASPNYVKELSFSVNNNLREQDAAGSAGLVGHGVGGAEVTGSVNAYFGDGTLLTKYIAGTATSLNARLQKNGQAQVHTFPNVKFADAGVNASAANQDVMQQLQFTALLDALTSTSYQVDRFYEYA